MLLPLLSTQPIVVKQPIGTSIRRGVVVPPKVRIVIQYLFIYTQSYIFLNYDRLSIHDHQSNLFVEYVLI